MTLSSPTTVTVIDTSAEPLMTDRTREALNLLLPVIEREARENRISIDRVEIRGFDDPEEGFHEIIVRQWVNVSADDALAYWDKLGAFLD